MSAAALTQAVARQPGISHTFADAVTAHEAMQTESAMDRALRQIRESVTDRRADFIRDRSAELIRQPRLMDLILPRLSEVDPAEGLRRCEAALEEHYAGPHSWRSFTWVWSVRACQEALRALAKMEAA